MKATENRISQNIYSNAKNYFCRYYFEELPYFEDSEIFEIEMIVSKFEKANFIGDVTITEAGGQTSFGIKIEIMDVDYNWSDMIEEVERLEEEIVNYILENYYEELNEEMDF